MKKQNKFGAIRESIDGHSFHSRAEARRYSELKLLERAGQITDLKLQVRFPLKVNDKLVCTYCADFTYVERGKFIVEDKKGAVTKDYALKRKLFAAIHGYEIFET